MNEKEKHPYLSQYLWEPDTPEQAAKKEAEYKEWCRTRTAFNIDNRIVWNMNGWDGAGDVPEAVRNECNIVHQYALRKVMAAPIDKAWETYLKVSQEYIKYLKKGIPASANFDPTVLG